MSGATSEQDRLRDLFATTSDGRPAAGTCPSPEEIWSAAGGEANRARTGALIDHALACHECGDTWRVARAMAAETASGDAAEPAPAVSRRLPLTRRGWWLAAAAAVVLVAVGVPYLWQGVGRQPGDSEYRSDPHDTIRSLVPRDTPLPRDAAVLRWSGDEGSRYDLRVADRLLKPLVTEKRLRTAEYRIPPERLVDLPAGATIYWQVEATLPDGRRVASPTFTARLE